MNPPTKRKREAQFAHSIQRLCEQDQVLLAQHLAHLKRTPFPKRIFWILDLTTFTWRLLT